MNTVTTKKSLLVTFILIAGFYSVQAMNEDHAFIQVIDAKRNSEFASKPVQITVDAQEDASIYARILPWIASTARNKKNKEQVILYTETDYGLELKNLIKELTIYKYVNQTDWLPFYYIDLTSLVNVAQQPVRKELDRVKKENDEFKRLLVSAEIQMKHTEKQYQEIKKMHACSQKLGNDNESTYREIIKQKNLKTSDLEKQIENPGFLKKYAVRCLVFASLASFAAGLTLPLIKQCLLSNR